ncbi:F1F0 ATP synthase subunit h Ecym_3095 [Eremothecium cymbalariae DBVPG|uniref:ATP synthase subunit H, mitochondrial n=1 Tax=Eremothecium cymbalariae (strain CBS 270.75 / DBVPG 7215 / KCTC 17166 / NRRL Y-17582) TaxID=931890 RepID=G8JR35_ERECY|nr:Hypothetical protein Ecym_3095 [Eremothecium cymbalariae DBVPG\
MFVQLSKRLVTRSAGAARGFSLSVARRDLVQDLYLKELRNTKVASMTSQDAQGSVKPWVLPSKPSAPEFGLSGAVDELNAYEAQEVETVGEQEAAETTEAAEGDWLVLEEVEEKDSHH